MNAGALSPAQRKYRARKRTWVVSLVLVILLLVLQVAAGAGLMALVLLRGFERHRGLPLADEDRALLVRIHDLVEDGADADEDLRKWHDHRGTVHLLGSGHAEGKRGPVRVHCEILMTADPEWATQCYLQMEMNNEAWAWIDPDGNLVQTARSELFSWGDESLLYTLSRGDRPAGIFFLARNRGTVFLLAVSGRKLSDPQLLEMLLGPVLREVERYRR